jgi:hypothetical protein
MRADLPTKFALAAQRRPWTTCILSGAVLFGSLALATGVGEWDEYLPSVLLALVSIGAAFLAEVARGAKHSLARLAGLGVASVAVVPIAFRWSAWVPPIFPTYCAVVAVALFWPQLAARIGATQFTPTRFRRACRFAAIAIVAAAPWLLALEIAAYRPSSRASVVVFSPAVLAVPFAFRTAVESSLHRWTLFAASILIGAASSLVPLAIGYPDSASGLLCVIPWIIGAPLAVLARAACVASAVPDDHTIVADYGPLPGRGVTPSPPVPRSGA